VESPGEDLYFGPHITFLHRTVRDYLREGEAQKLLAGRLKTPFEPRRGICNSILAQIKLANNDGPYWGDNGPVNHLVFHLLRQAKEIERVNKVPLGLQINQLESSIKSQTLDWWTRWTHGPEATMLSKDDNFVVFLSLIIQCHLSLYLQWRFEKDPPQLTLRPLQLAKVLEFALLEETHEQDSLNADIDKTLLDYTANPNLVTAFKKTPWHNFMIALYVSTDTPSPDSKVDKERFHTLEHLILGGADLSYVYYPPISGPYSRSAAGVSRSAMRNSTAVTIEQIIRKAVSPGNSEYLITLLKQQRQQKQQKAGVLSWLGWR